MNPPPLNPDAVYRAPSGRLCRLVHVSGREEDPRSAEFVYLPRTGAPPGRWADSFVLGRLNWHILKELPR